MFSKFSSRKANCDSVKSSHNGTAQSRPGTVSEPSTSASKHLKESKPSSRSSSKKPSTSSSNRSAGSSSKPLSKTSSRHSPKSSKKHNSNITLAEISANGRSYDGSTYLTHPMIERYVNSPTNSNPWYTTPTIIMTESDYQAQMRALLNGIDAQLDLSSNQVDFYDNQMDHYDPYLDLSEDESEKH